MKKLVNIDILVKALQNAGMKAGVCITGSTSYPLVRLADGLTVWGYVPDNMDSEDNLIAEKTLQSIILK